jgi:DNA-binding SARP family transcriptional activator
MKGGMGGRRAVQVRFLGDLEVHVGGQRAALPASKKTRALLGYLVVTGVPQLREHLCGLLWQGPDDPRGALRWSLTKLRGVLGEACIEADRERAAFVLGAATTDTEPLEAVLRAGVAGASTEALERAAACFRGELLEGLDLPDCFRWHEWCVAKREAMRAAHVGLLAALVERLATEPERALVHARKRLAVDPIAEEAHVAVVRLLTALGRNREAAEQVDACRRILDHELGTAPSAALLAARVRSATATPLAVTGLPSPPPPPAQATPPYATSSHATSPHATPAARPTAPPASAHVPFVGRTREIGLFDAAWREAIDERAVRAVLVLGEPGIGKSRLVAEHVARLATAGACVVQGRAFEAEMVRPYGPWIDALRLLGARDEARPFAADLAPILPELAPPDARAPAADRGRVFDAVAGLLSAVAAPLGCVVLLDDLQWFEEASLALLHYVCRAPGTAKVLVACTARSAELEENAGAHRLVRAMARDGRLTELRLGALDAEATMAIARSVDAGVDGASVARESGGNPLFALELARAARLGGGASTSLDALVADNLDRLEPRARELLPWAAAVGRAFRLEALGRAAGFADADLVHAAEELERRGVIRLDAPGDEGEGARYDFAHDLVRGAAYRRLSSARRSHVHGRIAAVLSERAVADPALEGEVVHHASLAGDHALAARAAVRASDRCLQMFATDEAARLAEIGFPHTARLELAERIRARVALLRVKVVSGRWLQRAGDLERDLRQAADEACAAGMKAEALSALHWLSASQRDRGDLPSAHETTLRGLELARGSDAATRGRQLAHTARCLGLLERDIDQADALVAEARDLVPAYEQDFEWCWADALVRTYCEAPGADALQERALALSRRDDNHLGESECLIQLAKLAIDGGDPGSALTRCRELSEVAGKMTGGSEAVIAAALEALARVAAADPGADGELERAIVGLHDVDAKGMLAYVLSASADVDRAAGRLARAQSRADAALAAAEAVQCRTLVAAARAALAELALARGDRADASRHLGAVEADLASPFGVQGRVRKRVERLRRLAASPRP